MITQSSSVDVSQAALDWLDYLSSHVDPSAVSSGSMDLVVSPNPVVRIEYQDEMVGCIANAGLDLWQAEGDWIGVGHPLTAEFESVVQSEERVVVRCHVKGEVSYLARVVRFSNEQLVVRRLLAAQDASQAGRDDV